MISANNSDLSFGRGRYNRKNRATRLFYRLALPVLLLVAIATPACSAVPGAAGESSESPTEFTVRIENISGDTTLPSPFAPGVWTVHDAGVKPLFDTDMPDYGEGLVAIAEDGDPSSLAVVLATKPGVSSSGVFDTPAGAQQPGPIFPGDAYEFHFTADSVMDRLSLASMLVQTNDIFLGPGPEGIALFDADGDPIQGDVTAYMPFWDVGSEVNEAPGMGPNQAPRQSGPNTGPAEGVVSAFSNTTRALPLASGMVEVDVTEDAGIFTFVIKNVSAERGAIATPLAPLFYATHNHHWQFFAPGQNASPGLEALAEDGAAPALVTEQVGAKDVGSAAATEGPAGPGGQFEINVKPTEQYPYLSLATMVVESNDAFLAFGPGGIRLLDHNGAPRPTADILADVSRVLAVWDAGTEANEVPGVGSNQPLRQSGANTGPVDPQDGVRLYSDPTNDLAGSFAGGFASLTIEYGSEPGSFVVTLGNTSGGPAYPTPIVWALHNDGYSMFQVGEESTAGLEALAEDGNPEILLAELNAAVGVGGADVAAIPVGGTEPGQIPDGGAYQFSVTPDMVYPYLSLATMVAPSNDTFLAFGPKGIRLLAADGAPRSLDDIANDITAEFSAWDAGTELNQASAAGPDQAPHQAGPNTGAEEGDSTVRLLEDPVWTYPENTDVVRVTITPHTNNVVYLSTSK